MPKKTILDTERNTILADVRIWIGATPPRERSIRMLADGLGVTSRTLSRWLTGETVPSEADLRGMKAWVRP